MFKAAEQYVAVSLLALFLGGCLYQNQKERIDPYIQPLFNPQHADVVYAVVSPRSPRRNGAALPCRLALPPAACLVGARTCATES